MSQLLPDPNNAEPGKNLQVLRGQLNFGNFYEGQKLSIKGYLKWFLASVGSKLQTGQTRRIMQVLGGTCYASSELRSYKYCFSKNLECFPQTH